MQRALVDIFVVPEESKPEFLEGAHGVQRFLKTLPGFVEGYLYEKRDQQGRCNYITVAVWESEEALESAKKATAAEFKKRDYDPQETRKKLKIESERAVYVRSPY